MKSHKTISLGLLILLLCSSVESEELNLIDFGKCKFEVTSQKEIKQFTGEKGNIIKASRRDARLVEVTLQCTTPEAGEFGLYPHMFGALFRYRGLAQVSPAVAMGTKIKDKLTGETREYWYNEPDVSIIIEVNAGERFTKYFIVEIPKEVNEFVLQGPMGIQKLSLGK